MVLYPPGVGAKSRSRTKAFHVAVDSGGTFTDCVWIERGRIRVAKVFSTPQDPSLAVLDALAPAGCTRSLTLMYGTTVGTNAILQRKGARVALVTTAGFEDVIEIGRQARPKLYDLFFERVEPLVPREMRFGVEERSGSSGEVVSEPSASDLQFLMSKIHDANPESIALSLLFSFANPDNESKVARALEGLQIPLSISHEILPEFREYERTSTVVVNAYLQPAMQTYLENLAVRLQEQIALSARAKQGPARIFVMQSSGGITELSAAARQPVRTVLSGPAGGVVGATVMARRSGYHRIISFDMGGTSTDVSLVDREIRTSTQAEIAGLPLGLPMLDIHTVGAGGGSIARLDAGGALRVGPESAGADPGPICYGRGTQPTVTDANLILGRLRPDCFLGGGFKLDLEHARRVIREWLQHQGSKLSLEQFASGIVRVVNANMEKAIRVVSVERGYDPREFTLVAFGGAGGLHACELAQALHIPRVIVPALPGALSAFGILASDVVKDYSRTVLRPSSEKGLGQKLSREFVHLRKKSEEDFRSEGWKGKIHYQPSVDIRYRGQGYELNVPFTQALIKDFQREHERRYGYRYPAREVEIVTLRLRAKMKSLLGSPEALPSPSRTQQLAPRPARIFAGGKLLGSRVYARDCLLAKTRYRGPVVITEYSATTFVPPKWSFRIDRSANLILEK